MEDQEQMVSIVMAAIPLFEKWSEKKQAAEKFLERRRAFRSYAVAAITSGKSSQEAILVATEMLAHEEHAPELRKAPET